MGHPAYALVGNRTAAHDPTRTITLRNRFAADASRRLRQLKQDITISVGELDVLGLADSPLANTPADPARFVFRRASDKADEFMVWLNEQHRQGLLEMVRGPGGGLEPWSNTYVRSAYQKGLANAHTKLGQAGVNTSTLTAGLPYGQGVSGLFTHPFHSERLALMYQRVFTDLKGVTDWMDASMRRVLTQGMVEGISPTAMARRLNDIIEKGNGEGLPPNHPKGIRGIERARLIARTETVETYNRASMAEYQRAGQIIGRPVQVQWWTARDEFVRDRHRAWHGHVYTMEQASGMIGAPNCRCSLLPVVPKPPPTRRRNR